MKDLDKRLSDGSIKPRRSLSDNFTSKTIARLEGQARPKPRPKWKEYVPMKLLHRPAFAALAAIVVLGIGGTTYAAVNGGLSSITALFGGEQQAGNGTRIVKVELQNCHDVNPFNAVSGTGKGDTPRYYRIKDSAHISNQSMVAMAQGICRASYNPQAEQALQDKIQNEPQNKDKLIGNAEGTIVALTPASIDIRVGGNVTSTRKPFVEHVTHLDPHLVVFDGSGVPKGLDALKVGEVVYSSYRATGNALAHSETTALDQVDWSHEATLVLVYKQSPDEATYDQYQKLTQKGDVTQVVPCHNTLSGYCTFDQLDQ